MKYVQPLDLTATSYLVRLYCTSGLQNVSIQCCFPRSPSHISFTLTLSNRTIQTLESVVRLGRGQVMVLIPVYCLV